MYHYYCIGRIVLKAEEIDEIQGVEVSSIEKYYLPTIPKSTITNVDKCTDYILEFVIGYAQTKFPDEIERTSEFDNWGLQFIKVLFEGKSIKDFNTAMYLDELKAQQDDTYFQDHLSSPSTD